MLYPHLNVNEAGHLTIGGADTVELARAFGTPAYILDENAVRAQCRLYRNTMRAVFGEDALPLYASKALSFAGIYRIAAEEGLGVDCVSPGELYTALSAGFPADKIYFHGNNKTDADLSMALDAGVGVIVADGTEELNALDAAARARGKVQSILLRITPGIDPHTHRAITTGNIDSKFGSAIATGAALAIVRHALALSGVRLIGFHCHIGSQIFEPQPFVDAARMMMRFIADVRRETGFTAAELNLGGGIGVPYTAEDPVPNVPAILAETAKALRAEADAAKLPLPRLRLEPGRSLVAAAGLTLYTVGSVKTIPGFRTYVSVDGGMPDNPRYALYGSRYTALIASRAAQAPTQRVTIAGRCCESGDLIGEDMPLQAAARGDVLAVLTTGAYNYSMASNYNRIPRPPVILVKDGAARVAVARESFADLVKNDIL